MVLALTVLVATPVRPEGDLVDRAIELLEGGGERDGELAVTGRLHPGGGDEGEWTTLELEVIVTLDEAVLALDQPRFRVQLVMAQIDADPWVRSEERTPEALGDSLIWLYRRTLEVPADFVEAAVAVEETTTGRWGIARAHLSAARPAGGDLGSAVVVDEIAEQPTADGRTEVAAEESGPNTLLRLVPPADEPVTGRRRVRTLESTREVDHVVFYLDGEVVGEDRKTPFSVAVDFGDEVRPHELSAVAYGTDDTELARDTVWLNRADRPFAVTLERLDEAAPSGSVSVVAKAVVPPERSLQQLQIYRGDDLVAAGVESRLTATVAVDGADYLRAVARLDDGSELDNVLLLDGSQLGERIDVNLVEVWVVATDRSGEPLLDLGQDDFQVTMEGRPVRLQRFLPPAGSGTAETAEEAPLELGLVMDTSESMWPLMAEAKQAGAAFLVQTITPGDRAFLVDFDTRPRLAQRATGDLGSLLRRFGGLEADGYTALYDACVFAMLEFGSEREQRALVVLTDGDDVKSQFGSGRCIENGQELGVPVYIIDLSGIQDPYRAVQKLDLEGIAEGTGGRVFYITDTDRLPDAYARINRELRSRYLLAFATEHPMSSEERASIEVDVGRRRTRVRWVVGSG